MAFQTITDIYVMEGTPSPYVALGLASLDVAVESEHFVQINSSDPLVTVDSSDPVLGPGVTIIGSKSKADVPFIISFDNSFNAGTPAGLDVVLTLTLYHLGVSTGDVTTINLHVLDNDDPNRPTDITLTGDSVAEDAAPGTVVGTLSTTDPNPGDTFTYLLTDTSNFVVVGNEIRVADNSKIDFETQPTQSFQVVTTDFAGHSFVKDVTINVTDVQPDLDVVTGALIQDVQENASVQVDLTLSDFVDPVGITGVSGDTDFFTLMNAPVGSGTGTFDFSLVFNPQDFEAPLDANGDNIYDYTITASDGVQTTSRTFHFTVTDVSPETLNGTDDGETLTGGSGIEFIFGFAGNDILNGMGNNDRLTGGLGKDWLTGGLGADIFDFDLKSETLKGAAKRDVIMDFNHFEGDHIDLSGIDAKRGAGNQAFKFIGGKAFHDTAGELHYIKKAGFLLVEGDINGDGRADFQIEVHGVTKLGGLDFFR